MWVSRHVPELSNLIVIVYSVSLSDDVPPALVNKLTKEIHRMSKCLLRKISELKAIQILYIFWVISV